MALEDKLLPQSYRSVDIDEYTFLRKKNSGDAFLKVLLFIVTSLAMIIFVFVLSNQVLAADPNSMAVYISLQVLSPLPL